jgi:glycosyltransferase involved in cell wall biosynthesis
VVEALAHGKPVIATRRAVEGLNVIDGTHLALAESNDEFVARIVELLGDPGRRATLARTAREWARANLDEQRRVAEYEALYDSLRSRPRPQ